MEFLFGDATFPELMLQLVTLTAIEVVLGIDNIIFISILSNKLDTPPERDRARKLGVAIAVISRVLLLILLVFIVNGETFKRDIIGWGADGGLSISDIILILGGFFLVYKSVHEIHNKLEGHEESHGKGGKTKETVQSILIQVLIIDVVFSLDSVITAVGLSEALGIMMIAILISAAMMIFASGAIASFVERHPTFKILALAFLVLIGTLLVMEGWLGEIAHDLHLKRYAYAMMAFATLKEVLDLRFRQVSEKPVELRNSHLPDETH